MRAIEWNETGRRFYETGIDRCVLYTTPGSGGMWDDGVAWNGLIAVEEAPVGGELSSYYYDGVKYLDYIESEEYQASLEAYTYPDEFEEFDGNASVIPGMFATGQLRKPFGLCYRSGIGSDTRRPGYDYKLHLVYNVIAQPATRSRRSVNGTVDPSTFQWSITGVPPAAPYPTVTYKPTVHFVLDTRRLDLDKLADLESYLYGQIPDDDIIDGGSPTFTSPGTLDGGTPDFTSSVLVDGGTATSSSVIVPTLLSPTYIKSLLS